MIIQGDCTIELPKLETAVDMVFTDPPYDISNDANSSMISFEYSSYTSNKGAWDKEVPAYQWVPRCCDLLKPGGIFACFGVFGSLVPIYYELEKHKAMRFQSHITWHKTNPAPSIHRRMLTHANEIILVYSKGPRWFFDYQYSKTLNDNKQKHNHFDIPAVKKVLGVTRKPPILCEQITKLFCPEGGIVLDPFSGSGAIPGAAKESSRQWIAIEKTKILCDYMQQSIGRKPWLVSEPATGIV